MGVMQDEIEGSTEAAAEGAADVVDDMAGDGVAADVAGDGLLDGGELTAGADGSSGNKGVSDSLTRRHKNAETLRDFSAPAP
jgi:hypothetical protein